MDKHVQPDITTPLQRLLSMALSAMMVECDQFTYFTEYTLCATTFSVSTIFYLHKGKQKICTQKYRCININILKYKYKYIRVCM